MKKFLALSVLLSLTTALSACDSPQPKKVDAMQSRDKALNCDDIQLEINESEFYRKEAEKSRAIGVKTLIMPVGYVGGYMNAGDAVDAADARISYLNRIYEIKKCDSQQQRPQAQVQTYQQAPQAYAQPQIQYIQQPVQQYSTVPPTPGY